MGALVQDEARRARARRARRCTACARSTASASAARGWSPTRAAIPPRCSSASCRWSRRAWSIIDHLIADAKSGVSGAGRKAELHLLLLRGVGQLHGLQRAGPPPPARDPPGPRAGGEAATVGLVFIAASHADDPRHPRHALRAHHEGGRFPGAVREALRERAVRRRACRAGSHPDTRSVRAANMCRIAVHRPPEGTGSDTLVVLSVIDNLVKGAAGQAVQNMNLMFGLPETAGLEQIAGGAVMHGAICRALLEAAPALRHRRAAGRGAFAAPLVLALARHRGAARRIGRGRGLDLRRRPPLRRLRPQRGAERARRALSASSPPRAPSSSGCARSPTPPTAACRSSARAQQKLAQQIRTLEQENARAARGARHLREHALVRAAQRQRRSRSTASRSSPTCCRANTAITCCSSRRARGASASSTAGWSWSST